MGISHDRVYQGYEVHCDGPGCREWDAVHSGWEEAARTKLEAKGWKLGRNSALCPTHAKGDET